MYPGAVRVNCAREVRGSNGVDPAASASSSSSTRRTRSISASARDVGTMSPCVRSSSGSPNSVRSRRSERHRSEALGCGHDDNHRVRVPRIIAIRLAAPTPEIDDLLAMPVRRDRGAYLAALGKIALELGLNFFEA